MKYIKKYQVQTVSLQNKNNKLVRRNRAIIVKLRLITKKIAVIKNKINKQNDKIKKEKRTFSIKIFSSIAVTLLIAIAATVIF